MFMSQPHLHAENLLVQDAEADYTPPDSKKGLLLHISSQSVNQEIIYSITI